MWGAGGAEDEGAEEAEEVEDENKNNKKKIIIGVLVAAALILLLLLIGLIVLLTARKPIKSTANNTEEEILVKRKADEARSGAKENSTDTGDEEGADGMDCPQEPPSPHGMIRTWDGLSHRTGITIGYKCDSDPDEEQIMMVVCVDHHWKILYQKTDSCIALLNSRKCLGDPLPSTAKIPFDWNYQKRDVGTRVIYKCNPAKGAPVMRILICTRDYEWRIFSDTADKCLCGKPLMYAPPITALTENWDGKTYKPGTTVKYSCRTGMGSTHFLTISCLVNATWLVTKTGSCFFLVDKPFNFSDAITYCSQMGGEMYAITEESEQDSVKNLLSEENAFGSTCTHKAFLGIREDISKQWQTRDGYYVSVLSELFFIVDEGRERCAVIQRPGNFKLNNVLCSGMQFCQMCEYGKNSTNADCPASAGTCYLAKTAAGDYKSSAKHCENDGGELVRLTNLHQLEKIRDMLIKNSAITAKCETGFFVGLRNVQRFYKTFKNKETNYTKFVDESRRSMNRHCVVIHELQRYMWTDEHCTLPSCFMCKMTGYPVGSFTPSDHKFIPVELSGRSLLSLQSRSASRFHELGTDSFSWSRNFRSRLLDPAAVACDEGWVTDGFHCYLFNNTMVTNIEARKFCENNYGILASLVTPFERNFIIEHLTNLANKTSESSTMDSDSDSDSDPVMWHVESTGGLPSLNNDFSQHTDFPCVSVYVIPSLGWSKIDCNQLARFICHD